MRLPALRRAECVGDNIHCYDGARNKRPHAGADRGVAGYEPCPSPVGRGQRVMRRAIALLLVALAATFPAAAQTTQDDSRTIPAAPLVMSPLASETPAWVAPEVEHLLGDPGGIRSDLENRGVYLRLNAIAEFAGNSAAGCSKAPPRQTRLLSGRY